jgi:hypothetical protein
MCSGLGHAAHLHDRKKHVQIPQFEAAPDMGIPIDDLGHKQNLLAIKEY